MSSRQGQKQMSKSASSSSSRSCRLTTAISHPPQEEAQVGRAAGPLFGDAAVVVERAAAAAAAARSGSSAAAPAPGDRIGIFGAGPIGLLAAIATPLLLGHVFMATVNPDTRPGLRGMITGFVDREWARHHYHLWYVAHFEASRGVVARDAEVPRFMTRDKMSLHQAGMNDVLGMLDMLGHRPRSFTLVGVQPVELADYGGSLTPRVRELVPQALELGLVNQVIDATPEDWWQQVMDYSRQFVPRNLDKLPAKDQPIIVLCAVGHRGGIAMTVLQLLGYTAAAPWGSVLLTSLPVAGRTETLRTRMRRTPEPGRCRRSDHAGSANGARACGRPPVPISAACSPRPAHPCQARGRCGLPLGRCVCLPQW